MPRQRSTTDGYARARDGNHAAMAQHSKTMPWLRHQREGGVGTMITINEGYLIMGS